MFLPSDSVVSAVVERFADLLASRQGDLGRRPLVLPNGDFFPDRFDGDEASVARLVRRMQEHAGLDDVPLVTRIVPATAAASASSCKSGACSVPSAAPADGVPRLLDDGQRWTLQVPEAEVAAPVVLTAMAARALGHVFLAETSRRPSDIASPVEVTADLSAVALGLGPLLLEGAYIYQKSCGGPQVGKVTHLSLAELSVATALFIELEKHKPRAALKALSLTQREALEEALEWARSNAALVQRLKSEPSRVAAGTFTLEQPRPWLLRVFGQKARARDGEGAASLDDFSAERLAALEATLGQVEKKPRKPRSPLDDELKALVDEAFAPGGRADAE